MAPRFERNLRQVATYWAPLSVDQWGKRTFSVPVQLDCRWEDLQQMFVTKTGEEKVSKSRVFFASSIDLDGYLKLGTDTTASPLGVTGAWEVMAVKTTPDLRNIKNLYAVML